MTRNKSRPLAIVAAAMLWAGFLQAQESVNTSGGDATGSGGSVAYSIGQLVFSTYNGTTGSEAQGVQHAYEVFTLDIKDVISNLSISILPNPTTDQLTINIDNYQDEKLVYEMYDVNGKLITKNQIISKETHIYLDQMPSATYFFYVLNKDNKKSHSYKIIKNN